MSLLVLGPVAGVAEGLVAGAVLADKRSLARVAAVVDLEVLQASKSARAAFNLESYRVSNYSSLYMIRDSRHPLGCPSLLFS